MASKILGLKISDTHVAAAEVLSGVKGKELLSCLGIPVENNDIESALKDIYSRIDHEVDRCIVSIPLSSTSFRNIRIPFKDDKKIRQALPFEIETLVPFPVDDMIFDYSIIDNINGANILTAGISKKNISGYLNILFNAGIDPDIIDVNPVPSVAWILDQKEYPENGLYLEICSEHQNIAVFQNRRIVIIRELSNYIKEDGENNLDMLNSALKTICIEVEGTIHSYNSQGNDPVEVQRIFFGGSASARPQIEEFLSDFFKVPAERVNIINELKPQTGSEIIRAYDPLFMENALAVALREQKKGRGFNFRRDEFKAKRSYIKTGPEFKKSAMLFALLFILLLFNTGIEFYFLNRKLNQVEQKYNEERIKRFPESINYKYPHIQLKQQLAELENSSVQLPGGINPDQRIIDILKDISIRISGSLDVDVSSMVVDQDTVRITGETDSYNTVDGLKNRLEPSSLFTNVTISSANVDRTGQRVKFDLKLARSK
ncbi:pilus assembly protein PilM [Thermodesulfobacteriota bacterium]